MKWTAAIVVASLATAAWHLAPLAEPPAPRTLEVGLARVRHPDFERINAVLSDRAPGWGIDLREHVSQAIAEESEAAGFDPLFVLAIIDVESEFREDARSVVGARGLMQIRPTTLEWVARREGLKLTLAELSADPSLNVRLGVRYLKHLKELFKGRTDLALMAYNAGPAKVGAGIRAKKLDPWRNYVRAVEREYAQLKRAHGELDDATIASRETMGLVDAR